MNDNNSRYDFLIVGAGLYGASAARQLTDRGFRVLVVEKKDHVAGSAYTEWIDGVCVHRYGPHIFHTDSKKVWDFACRFASFNDFINQPLANWHGELYSLPFNMNTFHELWGVTSPDEARGIIRRQIRDYMLKRYGIDADYQAKSHDEAADLEEQAIRLVGTEIYEKLIRGYTEKQWGRPCRELPASVIRRVPVRFEYNNNYYDDLYQGVPINGYTAMVKSMLGGIDVLTGIDYLDPANRGRLEGSADRIIFTGPIDEYYGYCFGPLGYRGLRFETERVFTDGGYYQPRAVVNYTDRETPWVRITEHRHFTEDTAGIVKAANKSDSAAGATTDRAIITREYPAEWAPGREPFYPVNDEESRRRYEKYHQLAEREEKVTFGGRLGCYRYYDMDDVIEAAIEDAERLAGENR